MIESVAKIYTAANAYNFIEIKESHTSKKLKA